ncbi:hypothetical protein L249_7088 [Ophiocordyceps polyrhachis-furcata BCC 54312]|uniref:Uncharacterized protein n=1 Tax=Ophiocordyceps polyrhachis-furcata BCC 54312 TaxID=1330021 RepID=A0A367LJW0_9HYPO|nr:hypothetical protein L249_7088 [Ophiocordyceps polyrhachis-furcata BCC 54312]
MFLPSYGPYGPAVTYSLSASYVVMPFLPLLCDVRRPRAGYGRPGVTVWRSRQNSAYNRSSSKSPIF